MRINFFADILGGQVLLQHGGVIKHWKFILYVFILIILYISIHFAVINAAVEIKQNAETIKALKIEYTWKRSRLLYSSRQTEVERLLNEHHSTLGRPEKPPVKIKSTQNVR